MKPVELACPRAWEVSWKILRSCRDDVLKYIPDALTVWHIEYITCNTHYVEDREQSITLEPPPDYIVKRVAVKFYTYAEAGYGACNWLSNYRFRSNFLTEPSTSRHWRVFLTHRRRSLTPLVEPTTLTAEAQKGWILSNHTTRISQVSS